MHRERPGGARAVKALNRAIRLRVFPYAWHRGDYRGSGQTAGSALERECAGEPSMAENLTVPEPLQVDQVAHIAARGVATWTNAYLRMVVIADACCGLGAGLLAFEVRFGGDTAGAAAYFWLGLALPALWLVSLALAGRYHPQVIRRGEKEVRRGVQNRAGPQRRCAPRSAVPNNRICPTLRVDDLAPLSALVPPRP